MNGGVSAAKSLRKMDMFSHVFYCSRHCSFGMLMFDDGREFLTSLRRRLCGRGLKFSDIEIS